VLLAIACSQGFASSSPVILPGQIDQNSCQSNSLAHGLFDLENSGVSTSILTTDFGYLEVLLRTEVIRAKGTRTSSTHVDWDRAVRRITGNRIGVGWSFHASLDGLFDAIEMHFSEGFNCTSKRRICSDFFKASELAAFRKSGDASRLSRYRAFGSDRRLRKPGLLGLSVSRVDAYTYSQGHIVTISGVKKRKGDELNPTVLLTNSAAHASSHQSCLASGRRTTGFRSWTRNFAPRAFNWGDGTIRYRLTWLYPLHETE